VQAAIEVRAVSHGTRAGETAVRDISLTIGRGELTAITGGSGSGKTTLLDAMSGLRRPVSGTVIRHPVVGPGPAGPVGYVPADDCLHPVLPLGRALRYTAALRAVPGGGQAAGAALGLTGLTARAAVPCGALGPGERKRAAIAAELMSRPAQLFLEEPTAGLDPAQAAEVLRLLRRLADDGITVVLTTASSLDAARCDKVAVMAAGGHLAFFGTAVAALGYFGADSLEEIYERLAGLGDPAAAWSRRFFDISRTRAVFGPVPTSPSPPGPALLLPDSAGPHSAGRVTASPFPEDPADGGPATGPQPAVGNGRVVAGTPDSPDGTPARGGDSAGVRPPGGPARGGVLIRAARQLIRTARQLPVLIRWNAEVLVRSSAARAVAAAAPVAVLLAFAALAGAGAFGAPGAAVAWAVLAGFGLGLGYGLLQARGEPAALRAERFAGLSPVAYVLARLAVALPLLAAADAIALVLPAACGRLAHGYGPAYLTMLLSSAVALALAVLLSAVAAARARPVPVLPALWRPALLPAGAVLALLDRPGWPGWPALAALAAALAVAATVLLARRVPAAPPGRRRPGTVR
jgi:ABC-type multidrug transport system ATPase subunit